MSAEVSILANHRLLMLEAMIGAANLSFVEIGDALNEIRNKQLYKGADFDSFEEYCRDRWDMTRSYASRLINAMHVYTVCCQLATADPPQNEAQCRELAKLEDPDDQLAAWKLANETAPFGKVSAYHVKQVVKSMLPGTKPEPFHSLPATEDLRKRVIRGVQAVCDGAPDEFKTKTIPSILRELADEIERGLVSP